MWDLPGSGIKPVSPALAGGFFNRVTREAQGPLLKNQCYEQMNNKNVMKADHSKKKKHNADGKKSVTLKKHKDSEK